MIYILENKWIFISLILLVIACETKKQVSKFKTTNVLFIAVDDLRPELGIYGNQVVKSPNIDQLARDGSFFSRHYVQVPTCGASRYSLMTGLRPRKKIHIDNRAFYSEMANHDEKDQPESIAHHFRRNGYTTVGIGKLSHSVDGLVYGYKEKPSDIFLDPIITLITFPLTLSLLLNLDTISRI